MYYFCLKKKPLKSHLQMMWTNQCYSLSGFDQEWERRLLCPNFHTGLTLHIFLQNETHPMICFGTCGCSLITCSLFRLKKNQMFLKSLFTIVVQVWGESSRPSSVPHQHSKLFSNNAKLKKKTQTGITSCRLYYMSTC